MTKYNVSLSQFINPDPYSMQSEIDDLIKKTIMMGLGVKNVSELKFRLPHNPRILIKPNWVLEKPETNESNMDCLITNKAIIFSILKFVNNFEPHSIVIGDSPIQLCDLNSIITDDYVNELQKYTNAKISIIDFRRFVLAKKGELTSGLIEKRSESNYVLFNLQSDSFLEPVTSKVNKFQITNYNVSELEKHHKKGFHEFLICKEVFDADLIINLPKLKMHRKAGYSGALKNFVGCIGDKTYLPHHRFGGTFIGGDCYPGLHLFKLLSEISLNRRNQVIKDLSHFKKWNNYYRKFMIVDKILCRRIFSDDDQIFEGSWYGNDTIWRTTLDIYKIIEFGDKNGIIKKDAQRVIWTLTDALICGEGNGPLNPTPNNLGLITFSNSAYAVDIFHGYLIGYEPDDVKYLENLIKIIDPNDINIIFENQNLIFKEAIKKFKVNLKRPSYWDK